MKKFTIPSPEHQEQLNSYFRSQTSFWKEIYSGKDVYARIHQHRQETTLAWIDSLALPPGARVLEAGCGAGYLSIELARRGFHVQAVDSTETMIEQARQQAQAAEVALSLCTGDITALPFEEQSFDLVVALGVIPWLERPELAIQEMARVTKPGGHILFTSDNRARLNALLDPLLNPLLMPVKRVVKGALERAGLRRLSLRDVGATSRSCQFIDRAVARAGLTRHKSRTLGFGPFTFFRLPIIPEPLGIRLNLGLQSLADRSIIIFRSTGTHYLVLAEKPGRSISTSENFGTQKSDVVTA